MPRRQNLIALRRQRKWSQRDTVEKLCEKFGINITISYYGMIEQGVRTPNLELALAIADLFEKPVRKIFFEQINNEMLDDVVQGDNPDAHTQTG